MEPLKLRNKSQTVICSKYMGTMRKHIEDSKNKAPGPNGFSMAFFKVLGGIERGHHGST